MKPTLFLKWLTAGLLALVVLSCGEFDDSEIWQAINKQSEEIAGERISNRLEYVGSACYYWTSSLNTAKPSQARAFRFASEEATGLIAYRYDGYSIRPVAD